MLSRAICGRTNIPLLYFGCHIRVGLGTVTKCGCSPFGGTLYLAFPSLYAASFRGFYFPR
jgi:hypothetical protein